MNTLYNAMVAPFRFMRVNLFVIFSLTKREVLGKFAGTYIGLLWALVLPLLQAGVYTFVFSIVLRSTPGGVYRDIPYPLWLLTGLLPWTMFTESLLAASGSVINNINLVKKTLLDKRVLPLTCVFSSLIRHALSIAVLISLLLFCRVPLHWSLASLVLPIILLTLFSMALSYLLAAITVFLRDIEQVLPIVLQVLFFATPIVYSADLVPSVLRRLLSWNPMYHVVTMYREIILLGTWPSRDFVLPALIIAALFLLSDYLFRTLSQYYCDSL